MPIQFSIVIITRNRERIIDRVLHTIIAQDFPNQAFELIVVDNGSVDGTGVTVHRTLEGTALKFKLVNEPVAGICRARNKGYSNAEGEWVAYVDDDALLPEKWLSAYKQAIDQFPGAAAFGGPAELDRNLKIPWWWSKWLDGIISCQDYGESTMPYALHTHPYGLNMVIRKEILNEYHGFNTSLDKLTGSMADETDLFYRLKADDRQLIYVPEARVIHSVMQNRLRLRELRKRSFRTGESHAYLDSKYDTTNGISLSNRFRNVLKIPKEHRSPVLYLKEYFEWRGYSSFRKKYHEL